MKSIYKKLLNVFFVVITPNILAAQGIVNNGSMIQVSMNTDVKITGGGVQNIANGSINNSGNIYLDQDWTQTGASTNYSGGGWMWFENGSNQLLSSVAPINVPRLKVDNGNKLLLGSDVTVSSQLDLVSTGNVELGVNNLILTPSANIYNYNANSYIITNSTGILQRQVGAAAIVFPVGNTRYNPVTLTNNGTVDNFQIRVEDQVWDNGTTGNLETSNIVNRTWHIAESVVGGSDVTMTVQWENPQEIGGFDRSNCAVSHWDGSAWDHSMTYAAATNVGLNTWTQTRTGQTSFSPFAVEDNLQVLPIELLYFQAKRQNANHVNLDWATSLEINNQGFEIERMLDNETSFQRIGWMDGAGNSTTTQNYTWVDVNAYPKTSYYRLKQVDVDGSFSYSPVRAVDGVAFESDIVLMPNPTSSFINVRFGELNAKNVRIQIFAADGKLVLNKEYPLSAHQVLELSETQDFAAGTYFLQALLDNGTSMTKKFIKLKF